MSPRLGTVFLVASALLLSSASALAQPSADARARAKEAYDRGVDAHARGDLQTAAREFARADALAPSPVALQAALDAAIDADDPALGAELLERSAREKAGGPLAASIQVARSKFAGRAGRVRVKCPPSSTCLATLDGNAIETTKPSWATTGQHTVVVQVDGDVQTRLVRVEAGQTADVEAAPTDASPAHAATDAAVGPAEPAAAPAEDRPARESRHRDGLPPIFFYGGVGATVILAGATTLFAIDTSNKHDEFETLGCGRANLSDCETLKSDGEASQRNTNIALVATGVFAVATAVVGFAFTDWKGPLVAVTPGGGAVAFSRKF